MTKYVIPIMWYIKIINPRLSTVVGNGFTWPTHLTYPKKKISTQKVFYNYHKVCEIFNTFYILIPFNKLFLKAFLCFFYLDIFKYVNKNACKKLMLKSDLRLFIVLLPPISYEAYIT